MVENTITRILWLSDIHFRSIYSEQGLLSERQEEEKEPSNQTAIAKQRLMEKYKSMVVKLPDLDTYLNEFIQKVSTLKQNLKGEEIDYLFISGDLAFSGTSEDYIALQEKLIQPLVKVLGSKVKIVCIPGNHDVNWDKSRFMGQFWDILKESDEVIRKRRLANLRNKFLKERSEFFGLLFSQYTDFLTASVIPTLDSLEIKFDYGTHGLFGMIIDHSKKLVFNLFNSSWFALGQQFDGLLLKHFKEDPEFDLLLRSMKKKNEKDAHKLLSDLVDSVVIAKNLTQEYGEQILGESLMPVKQIVAKLAAMSGYCVISSFHHPPNWLQYSQKYSPNLKNNDALFFNKIMKETQLLLTGHEHVPSSVLPEHVYGLQHLKGGMFLQDNVFSPLEGQHRFSLLEINISKSWFSETKFYYDHNEKKWEEDIANSHQRRPFRAGAAQIDKEKITHLKKMLEDDGLIMHLVNLYFFSRKPFKLDNFKPVQLGNLKLQLYVEEYDGKASRVLIVPLDASFFRVSLKKKGNEHPFDIVIKKLKDFEPEASFTIVTPDFLVGDAGPNQLEGISEKADFVFNNARHYFFNRFEMEINKRLGLLKKGSQPGELAINGIFFATVCRLKFSIQVIPFWIFEKYINFKS